MRFNGILDFEGHSNKFEIPALILTINFIFQRLVVCLEESLFIHNIRDMKVLHTIRETPPNKNGLCALSIDSDHCYLAYPGHSSVGELQIFDALHLVMILPFITSSHGKCLMIQLYKTIIFILLYILLKCYSNQCLRIYMRPLDLILNP